MIANTSPEVVEALVALENNGYFKAVKQWIKDSAQASLDSTSPIEISQEYTFRALGAYHALNGLIADIESAPEKYRNNRDTS